MWYLLSAFEQFDNGTGDFFRLHKGEFICTKKWQIWRTKPMTRSLQTKRVAYLSLGRPYPANRNSCAYQCSLKNSTHNVFFYSYHNVTLSMPHVRFVVFRLFMIHIKKYWSQTNFFRCCLLYSIAIWNCTVWIIIVSFLGLILRCFDSIKCGFETICP